MALNLPGGMEIRCVVFTKTFSVPCLECHLNSLGRTDADACATTPATPALAF